MDILQVERMSMEVRETTGTHPAFDVDGVIGGAESYFSVPRLEEGCTCKKRMSHDVVPRSSYLW